MFAPRARAMGMDFAAGALPPYTARTVPLLAPTARCLRWTLLGLGALAGCGEPPAGPQEVQEVPVAVEAPAAPAEDCPAGGFAPPVPPRTGPEHQTLAYWLERTAEVTDLDRPVLDAAQVRALNARAEHDPALGFGGRADLRAPIDVVSLAKGLQERLGFLRDRFTSGKYVRLDGSPVQADLQARYASEITPEALALGLRGPVVGGAKGHVPGDSSPEPELRVALGLIPIHCGPQIEPYYTPSRDPEFERNLCSMARAQEVVQILRPWDHDLVLARTSYVVGWIDMRNAALSPPLSPTQARAFLDGPHRYASAATTLELADGTRATLPFAALVPVAKGKPGHVLVATATGVHTASASPQLAESPRPLSRRAVLTAAFAYLGAPYGWGDRDGGRDCSRYLMDLFAGLGLELPRHTSDQAIAGSYTVDVPPATSEPDRLALLDEHHRRGVVLLHFPGHIMLYLGRDTAGAPMAIHSFAEYLVPCAGRAADAPAGERETLLKVNGVHVSDLELGRGTSRTAFLQRITKITVLGPNR